MTQIHAYADIPNGYNGRWVRVGFALIGRRPICIHDNGTWHYCAFIVDVDNKDELLYRINPNNGADYSDYIREFDLTEPVNQKRQERTT